MQKSLFANLDVPVNKNFTGTFVDNLKLPIHRWFRYSAGFSAEWVEAEIANFCSDRGNKITIFDPFAGSGTTLIASDKLNIHSVGIEAHPFIFRIAKAKSKWNTPVIEFQQKAEAVLHKSTELNEDISSYPPLIAKCYDIATLSKLDRLRRAWLAEEDGSNASELVWLAITSILRQTSEAGTAQWQYIQPKKKKKIVAEPFAALRKQLGIMQQDMLHMQRFSQASKADLISGDIRDCPKIETGLVDLVITSPPYANNFDYADSTRFEMCFWKELSSWGELHNHIRKFLIRSSSQHVSKDRLNLDSLLNEQCIAPIKSELSEVCAKLSSERLQHGGKKHYHTMVAAYFVDMALAWQQIRRICKADSRICYVIGDSAPYGIYVPVDQWLGELAVASGFKSYSFEKLRDRNIKWLNRKHRVPLHEGRLWVEG